VQVSATWKNHNFGSLTFLEAKIRVGCKNNKIGNAGSFLANEKNTANNSKTVAL